MYTKKRQKHSCFIVNDLYYKGLHFLTYNMWLYCIWQESLEKAQLHALHGEQLIQSNHYAVDSIRPKCVELRRICDDFSNEAKKKYDVLSKSLEIHTWIEKVGGTI